jgi:hypothetical protein
MEQIRLLRGMRVWLVPLATASFACSSQVDSDYRGEAVATLRGAVTVQPDLESSEHVSAALLWAAPNDANGPRIIGERVDVTDSFPASFALRLYGPPPAEAESKTDHPYCFDSNGGSSSIGPDEDCDGEVLPADTKLGLWIGFIGAIDSDAPDGDVSRDDIVGIDVDHMIYYVDHDGATAEPEASTATPRERFRHRFVTTNYEPAYGVGYEAGYHLARYNPDLQEHLLEQRDCQWEGLCVHWMEDEHVEGSAYRQDRRDWEYERCMQRFPENPTCSGAPRPAEGESASSVGCRERYHSWGDRTCTFTGHGANMLETAHGLEDPIEIQLGMEVWDAAWGPLLVIDGG